MGLFGARRRSSSWGGGVRRRSVFAAAATPSTLTSVTASASAPAPADAPEAASTGTGTPAAADAGSASSSMPEKRGPLTHAEIQQRRIGDSIPQSFRLGSTGFTLRFASLSQRGYYPEDLFKANQDRFLVLPGFHTPETILMGVFDGHGHEGDHCSNFARQAVGGELARLLGSKDVQGKEAFASEAGIARAYKDAFLSVNRLMHLEEAFDDDNSGTTAITALLAGSTLYIANIGDSRAILGKRRGAQIVACALSVDQTPYRADERARVRACGGIIMTERMRAAGLDLSAADEESWNMVR